MGRNKERLLPTDKEKQANTGVEQVKAVVRACQWPMQDYGFTTATKNPIKHIHVQYTGETNQDCWSDQVKAET